MQAIMIMMYTTIATPFYNHHMHLYNFSHKIWTMLRFLLISLLHLTPNVHAYTGVLLLITVRGVWALVSPGVFPYPPTYHQLLSS